MTRDRGDRDLLGDVERYYTQRVQAAGATPRGVDWNSQESQELRFAQLARLWEGETGPISLVDYGCGYGALVDWLRSTKVSFRCQGFDISPAMIEQAASRAGVDASFTADASKLVQADYVVASGIFNVRLTHDDASWEAYMQRTLSTMSALATRGLAFNVLTAYSDADKKRPDLYYGDPMRWFDYCKRTFSPRVTLVHDYPLYEFTLLVRKA